MPSCRSGACQAAVFVGPGRALELRMVPLPTPGPEEALIRVECCTLCGSDLHTISGARTEAMPSILGHEILGVVERIGDPPPCEIGGSPLRVGDRITWSTSVSCGDCDRCRAGLPQKCRTLAKYGHELAEGRYALSGGLAEFLLLRRGSTAIRIDAQIPAPVICPVNCATATVAAAVRAAGISAARRVLILGAGMLGVTAAAFVKAQGAEAILVCDPSPRRLEWATRFGADACVEWSPEADSLTRRLSDTASKEEFDLVLELSGSPDAVEAAVRLAGVGTHIVLVGSVMRSRSVQVDPEKIVRGWLTIQGVHNYAPLDLQAAVEFLMKHGSRFPFAELVEFSYPLSEVNTALDQALRVRPFRVAVLPGI